MFCRARFLSLMYANTHLLFPIPARWFSLPRTYTHLFPLSDSLIHFLSHSLSRCLCRTLSRTLSCSLALPCSLLISRSLALSYTLSHSLTRTHARSVALSLSLLSPTHKRNTRTHSSHKHRRSIGWVYELPHTHTQKYKKKTLTLVTRTLITYTKTLYILGP